MNAPRRWERAPCDFLRPKSLSRVSRFLSRFLADTHFFPTNPAVVTNPTRGAKPSRQRVAVRGRRWQNLLPLGVSGGCGGGAFPDLPLAATPCHESLRRFLRRFLRHPPKANSYGDERKKGLEPLRVTGTMGRLNVKVVPGSSRDQIVGWLGDALKIKDGTARERASQRSGRRASLHEARHQHRRHRGRQRSLVIVQGDRHHRHGPRGDQEGFRLAAL